MPVRPLTTQIIRDNVKAGAWQELPLYAHVDSFADETPDKLATADQHERLSYAEFVERSKQLARGLLRLGLDDGDPVLVQGGNRLLVSVAHLACNRANLTYVPISSAWRQAEMRQLLGLSGARVAILPEPVKDFDFVETVAAMRSDLPALETVVGTDLGSPADLALNDLFVDGDESVDLRHDPNAPYFAMATSGTTDLPHLSAWSDNNLWFFLSQYRAAVELSPDDVIVGLAPASTGSTGYVFPVLAPLLCGAAAVLLEHWTPDAALDLIASEQATGATAIPTQIIKMLSCEEGAHLTFPAMRFFNNAGAAMPPDHARALEERFGCTVQTVYGATDGGVPVMTRLSDPPQKRFSTVGKMLPHTEMRLIGGDLEDVPSGERGEIIWRNPTKSFGYINEEERSAAAFWEDGWYRSGDLGEIDEDGYLRIVGRAKDLIIRGGQNISPREIEEAIIRHPAVLEVAVVGYPDPIYGERVCACVVPNLSGSFTFAEMIEHLEAQGIAKFKLPERLEHFDQLPRSAGEKFNKVAIRQTIADRGS